MEICMCVYAFDAFQWLSCAKSEKISTSTCQQRLLIRTSGVHAGSLEKKMYYLIFLRPPTYINTLSPNNNELGIELALET